MSDDHSQRLPHPPTGTVYLYTGEQNMQGHGPDVRTFKMYVWGNRDGFQIAVLNTEASWEYDDVTDSWSIPEFYDEYEEVSQDDFPR